MNDHLQYFIEKLTPVANAIEEILSPLKDNECLPLPTLMDSLAHRFSWTKSEQTANDPLVRGYLRDHKEWYVRRGAYGGIMRRSQKEKQLADAAAKKAAKEQVEAAIQAKVQARMSQASETTSKIPPTPFSSGILANLDNEGDIDDEADNQLFGIDPNSMND